MYTSSNDEILVLIHKTHLTDFKIIEQDESLEIEESRPSLFCRLLGMEKIWGNFYPQSRQAYTRLLTGLIDQTWFTYP